MYHQVNIESVVLMSFCRCYFRRQTKALEPHVHYMYHKRYGVFDVSTCFSPLRPPIFFGVNSRHKSFGEIMQMYRLVWVHVLDCFFL